MNSLTDTRRQAGAVVYRVAAGLTEVLLVTSLDTKRWIVPKGNIEQGLSPAQTAARETAEEAGVEGQIVGTMPLGFYTYFKRLKSGKEQPTTVEVYLLHATQQLSNWPEKGQRDLLWLPLRQAIGHVQEPGLAPLLARVTQLERARQLPGQDTP